MRNFSWTPAPRSRRPSAQPPCPRMLLAGGTSADRSRQMRRRANPRPSSTSTPGSMACANAIRADAQRRLYLGAPWAMHGVAKPVAGHFAAA